MAEIETQLREIYVQPGDLYVSREPVIIRTILGSCVGGTFWNARLGVAALFHAQLPRCPDLSRRLDFAAGRRYVDFSIRYLARQFDELGARRPDVQVKLFGGADVLLVTDPSSTRPTVGKMNCEVALEVLRAEGFDVVASSLGGTTGLNLRFHTSTGEVFVRRLT